MKARQAGARSRSAEQSEEEEEEEAIPAPQSSPATPHLRRRTESASALVPEAVIEEKIELIKEEAEEKEEEKEKAPEESLFHRVQRYANVAWSTIKAVACGVADYVLVQHLHRDPKDGRFGQLLKCAVEAALNNTQFLCYLAFVATQIANSDMLSLPLVISAYASSRSRNV
jgi:hypothetical protein